MKRVLGLLGLFAVLAPPRSTLAATLPPSFQESTAFSGLANPTVVQFAPDGRVFVAEKSGLIKVFDSLTDTTPTVFADLRTNVHNYWDRGLLGLALRSATSRPTPYVYVLYTLDRKPGGTIPTLGDAGRRRPTTVPTPPGPTSSGCVVTARLSRLQAAGDVMTGSEQVLIEDWCQQFPSHSIGGLAFGPDGALYVSGGDGASFNSVDYGQYGGTGGTPLNLCGDPPAASAGTQTPPTARGRGACAARASCGPRATRSRSTARSCASTPIDRPGAAGQPARGQPRTSTRAASSRTACATRSASRSGRARASSGSATWAGTAWEEIDRFDRSRREPCANFGWPCYEGDVRQAGYDAADLDAVRDPVRDERRRGRAPFFTYSHAAKVVAGETCPTGKLVDRRPRVLHDRQLPRRVRRARSSSPTTPAGASGR